MKKSNRMLREAFKRAYPGRQKARYQIPSAEQDSAEWKKLTEAEKWKNLTEAHQDPPKWKNLTEAQQELRQQIELTNAESEAQRARDGGRIIARERKAIGLDAREIAARFQEVHLGIRCYRKLIRMTRVSHEIQQAEQRPATAAEIAERLGLTVEEVDALRRAFTRATSLDHREIDGKLSAAILDNLVTLYADDGKSDANDFPSPIEVASEIEGRERIAALLAILTPVEREACLRERLTPLKKSRQTVAVSRHRAIAKMRAEALRRGWRESA